MSQPSAIVKRDTLTYTGNHWQQQWGANHLFSITAGPRPVGDIEDLTIAGTFAAYDMILKDSDGNPIAYGDAPWNLSTTEMVIDDTNKTRIGLIRCETIDNHHNIKHLRISVFSSTSDIPVATAELCPNLNEMVLYREIDSANPSCLLVLPQPNLPIATISRVQAADPGYRLCIHDHDRVDERVLSIFVGFLYRLQSRTWR